MSFMSVREGRKGQGPSVSHCSPEGMAHTPQPAQTLPTLSSMPLCHHSGPVAMLMGGSRHAHPEGGISAHRAPCVPALHLCGHLPNARALWEWMEEHLRGQHWGFVAAACGGVGAHPLGG